MTDQPAVNKPRRGRPSRDENIHHIFLRVYFQYVEREEETQGIH